MPSLTFDVFHRPNGRGPSPLSPSCVNWTKLSFSDEFGSNRIPGTLVGAFRDRELIGVLGMRPVHTLARGAHLHVDDLVVAAEARGSGAGHALMAYAEADARARDMSAVFLDARPDAVSFYESRNYALHSAPSMKKMI